ncbi:unnamed protein product [Pedinophyceae sp. YPF-701]|nr:unnamed protein product [Pedinophyceae sp. YPF-701]
MAVPRVLDSPTGAMVGLADALASVEIPEEDEEVRAIVAAEQEAAPSQELTVALLAASNLKDRADDEGAEERLRRLPQIWLDRLRLSALPLSALDSVAGCTSLHLQHNRLQDASPLAALRKLEFLILRNNRIEDVTPLAGLEHLQLLDVSENRLQAVPHTAFAPQLRFLKVEKNPAVAEPGAAAAARRELVAHLVDLRELDGAEVTHTEMVAARRALGLSVEGMEGGGDGDSDSDDVGGAGGAEDAPGPAAGQSDADAVEADRAVLREMLAELDAGLGGAFGAAAVADARATLTAAMERIAPGGAARGDARAREDAALEREIAALKEQQEGVLQGMRDVRKSLSQARAAQPVPQLPRGGLGAVSEGAGPSGEPGEGSGAERGEGGAGGGVEAARPATPTMGRPASPGPQARPASPGLVLRPGSAKARPASPGGTTLRPASPRVAGARQGGGSRPGSAGMSASLLRKRA